MNPIKKIRKEKGLTMSQLAMIAGVSATRINQIERGDNVKLRGPILSAVDQLGYDPTTISTEYTQWREKQISAVLQWARSGGGGDAA